MAGALVTSVVVAAMPLLGDVHLDGDGHGRGVLAWSGLRGSAWVARATDVYAGRRTGRLRDLWHSRGSAVVEGVDVAGSGAAVVCLRERPGRTTHAWRVRAVLRGTDGAWSRPVLVAAPGRWVDHVECGVDDAGNALLAWTEGIADRLRAAAVRADGTVLDRVTLARNPEPPDVAVAPSGAAAISFATGEPGRRRVWVAARPPGGGWSTRRLVPPPQESVLLPQLAVDGAGRWLLGWDGGDDVWAVRLAAGADPARTPSTVVASGDVGLGTLEAGARGDVLLTYYTAASTGGPRAMLHAVVQRPGAPLGAPAPLGRFAAYPLAAAVAADGSGTVAWVSGSRRRPRTVARSLSVDGRWGPTRQLSGVGQRTGLDIGIAAGRPGQSTVAWSVQGPVEGRDRLLIAGL